MHIPFILRRFKSLKRRSNKQEHHVGPCESGVAPPEIESGGDSGYNMGIVKAYPCSHFEGTW
jgi:hypothetical protein